MGAAARQFVAEHFGIDEHVAQHVALYKRLMARTDRKARSQHE
jgi:hypothetical protein